MSASGSLFRTTFHSCWIAALVGSGWLMPAAVQAQSRSEMTYPTASRNSSQVLAAFRTVVAEPSESTVSVRCDDKQVALGTIVAADGWIMTKYSELSGPVTCQLKDGRSLAARLVGMHGAYDLALLKVEAKGLKPVRWGDPKTAAVGNWVASPGRGLDPIAIGVVSVAARKVSALDLPLSEAYLGIGLEDDSKGVKIIHVEPGSGAFRAGFKQGDVVVALAGQPVRQRDGLITMVQRYKVGDEVTLKILRGDQEMDLKAILGKRPGRAQFQNRLGNDLSLRLNGFPSILQHDTVLKPSECGGPLVDLDGKALGINIARAGRVESYAVPVDAVLALLPDLKAGKLPPPELKEALARVEAARANLAQAEKALKDIEQQITEAKLLPDKAVADHQEAQKRIKEAKIALEKAELELKAWK